MKELPREYRRIQKLGRISIPSNLLETLDWRIGEMVMIEAHKGKLIIESIEKTVGSFKERYYK